MLGQPVYFLTPDVVGVHLSGSLREGVTATDLVLRVTEMMRRAKVVGKFVEFHGEGASTLSVVDRATIANMAPEYGATMGFFPVDEATCEYLLATGRSKEHVDIVRSYYRRKACLACRRRRSRIQRRVRSRHRLDRLECRWSKAAAGSNRSGKAERSVQRTHDHARESGRIMAKRKTTSRRVIT